MAGGAIIGAPITRRDALRLALRSGVLTATTGLATRLDRSATVLARMPPAPRWGEAFAAALADTAGYAYAVARDGQVVERGAAGLARSRSEGRNPDVAWETGTRMNLASVSKTITAVAIMALAQQGAISRNRVR